MNGIEPVPENQRTLNGFDFFLLWAGAAVSLAEIWAGGILVPLGYMTGLVVIILGHIIGNTPLALGGLIGSRWGIPSMVGTRPAFGVRGSYLPALLNIFQLIGWTAVMVWIGGQAAATFTKDSSILTPRFWIVVLGVVTTVWALVGYKYWKWLHRVAITALVMLCFVMTYIVFKEYGIRSLLEIKATGKLPFMLGLDYVIIMPISWLPLVCDYSRYARRDRGSFWGTWVGYFIISSWMYLIGMSAALATQSHTPEVMVLELMVSFGLVVPAMIIVLFSTFTTTFLDIYSTSVSALNIYAKLGEKKGIILGGAFGTIIALIFGEYPQTYSHFLETIGFIFCPLFGVVLVDYFFTRNRVLLPEALFTRGAYWYTRGFHLTAIACWAIGAVTFKLGRELQVGGAIPSFLIAALIYLLVTRGFRGKEYPAENNV
ncbi:MAG: putative hydroxymethylpyrimidine transporter CytX [Deltaproteobacteria bacterium]|nr:putative hydroxymethylpyrimidine transporter CytX [Deltaproteobacteria bacterium]MBW2085957.1 putative hydroxymethylpyrimidine transporter CytX [Deltaproteobacteria bacterium]